MTSPSRLNAVLTSNMALVMLVVVMTIVISAIGDPLRYEVVREGGPIEIASAVGYFLCYVLCLFLVRSMQPRMPLSQAWPLLLTLLFLGARELDLDKVPFTKGVLKAKQYTSDDVALGEKLISLAILILLIVTVVTLIRRFGPALIRGIRAGQSHSRAIGLGILFAVLSKSVDGLNRKLEPFGVQVSDETAEWARVFEEVAELGIVLAFLQAVLILKTQQRSEVSQT